MKTKNVKHPLLKKGTKKLRFKYLACWIGLHDYRDAVDSQPCTIKQNSNDIGSCNITLYRCWKCGKEKIVATGIQIDKNTRVK